jgi:hypothetical protein
LASETQFNTNSQFLPNIERRLKLSVTDADLQETPADPAEEHDTRGPVIQSGHT